MKNCLLCGVGGQGTVLASRVIAAAAMEKGLFARTAETIGMAQRGGSVVSHVRIGESVPSPLIPLGEADVILGFEPGEALRNLGYLKPGGTVILCSGEVQPVTAALAKEEYSGKAMADYIKANIKNTIILDTDAICKECGSAKVVNTALLGALAQCQAMDLDYEEIKKALLQKVKREFAEINEKALTLGANYAEEK